MRTGIEKRIGSYNSILEGQERVSIVKKDFVSGIVIIGEYGQYAITSPKSCTSCVAGLPSCPVEGGEPEDQLGGDIQWRKWTFLRTLPSEPVGIFTSVL